MFSLFGANSLYIILLLGQVFGSVQLTFVQLLISILFLGLGLFIKLLEILMFSFTDNVSQSINSLVILEKQIRKCNQGNVVYKSLMKFFSRFQKIVDQRTKTGHYRARFERNDWLLRLLHLYRPHVQRIHAIRCLQPYSNPLGTSCLPKRVNLHHNSAKSYLIHQLLDNNSNLIADRVRGHVIRVNDN